jgi:hypothetical protein
VGYISTCTTDAECIKSHFLLGRLAVRKGCIFRAFRHVTVSGPREAASTGALWYDQYYIVDALILLGEKLFLCAVWHDERETCKSERAPT